jgi:predicted transcriptional regulator
MVRQKKGNTERIAVTFKVDKTLIKRLKVIASVKDKDMSHILEEIIREYIKKESGQVKEWTEKHL